MEYKLDLLRIDEIIKFDEGIQCRREIRNVKEAFWMIAQPSPTYFLGSAAEGLDCIGSDEDYMFVNNDIIIIATENQLPSSAIHEYGMVVTDGVPPGQALIRIMTPDPTNSNFRNNLCFRNQHYYLKNDIFGSVRNSRLYRRKGPSNELVFESGNTYDNVHSFKYSHWPNVASKWLHRDRPCVWPSKALIDKISERGCHLVGIGIPESETENIEWRLSFVLSERDLVDSFSYPEMRCYFLLKILLKQVIEVYVNDLLTSYHIKTLLFWIKEQTNLPWTEETFLECFMVCLNRLKTAVGKGRLDHYFIPQCNLFLRKIEGSAQRTIYGILEDLCNEGYTCIRRCPSLADCVIPKGIPFPRHASQIQGEREALLDIEYFYYLSSVGAMVTKQLVLGMPLRSIIAGLLKTRAKNPSLIYHQAIRHLSVLTCVRNNFVRLSRHSNNKEFYRAFGLLKSTVKRLGDYDISTAPLLLATAHLYCGKYTDAVSIAETVLRKIPPHRLYKKEDRTSSPFPAQYRDEMCGKGMSLTRKSSLAVIKDISFLNITMKILPIAIEIESHADPENRFVSVRVPPVLYLHYIRFLCYVEIGDVCKRDLALEAMIETVNSRENDGGIQKFVSCNVTGHCLLMTERLYEAFIMFCRSLSVKPQKNAAIWYISKMLLPLHSTRQWLPMFNQ